MINDINSALITTYHYVQTMPGNLYKKLYQFDVGLSESKRSPYIRLRMKETGKSYYYVLRDMYNEKLADKEYDLEMAALFIFLNKHCFNGLYRVNKQGQFNVPYNKSTVPSACRANIMAVSEYLQNVIILNGDFEAACENARAGDFVFFDSPYAPLNPTSFEAYTKEGFALEEHERLARLYDRLSRSGVFCMLTNHDTPLVRELYENKGYRIDTVDVRRSINSDGKGRMGTEVIICNY